MVPLVFANSPKTKSNQRIGEIWPYMNLIGYRSDRPAPAEIYQAKELVLLAVG